MKKLPKLSWRDQKQGTTLVELLVAVAVFTVIMISVMQIFSTSAKMNRAFLAKTEAMNEASYLMEYISRALRMAQKDSLNICGNGANANFGQPNGSSSIGFMAYDGKCQKFFISAGALWSEKNGVASELTAPFLSVTKFNVAAAGWDQNDYLQPRVTISLNLKDRSGLDFILQTAVSQRNPDIIR